MAAFLALTRWTRLWPVLILILLLAGPAGMDPAWGDPGGLLERTELSIADIASSYEDNLSRPLIPETSLWLPLGIQIILSFVIILLMFGLSFFGRRAFWAVMLLTVFTISRHLMWRGVETLDYANPASSIAGFVIYAAELLAFVSLLLGYFQIVGETDHKPIPITDRDPAALPSVDILVCTYNEPINVLYRTLVGCQGIDYPNKSIYLCDDGNRPEMEQLARRLGVHYLSRTENIHAKAGNLNNAMQYSNGELVLVFDADHVPCKTFLKEVIGFFDDAQIGFVQTPQHFFTQDPFQRNLIAEDVINNEQDLFFHVIEPGNDYWDAAFFAGSGAIFRRKALEEIDGFAVETITEDVHTGLRLHSAGWKSLYYNRDLSAGMASDNFSDFVKQRIRWARGMTQILFFDNPWLVKGLSLTQRLCYFAGIWYFFHGFPRLVFLIAPLFFLLFGLKPVDAGFLEVLIYYAPSFVCLILGYAIISRGMRQSFWSEVYETAICTYLLQTNIVTLLSPRRAKFRVTPKEGFNPSMSFHWEVVAPQIIIGLLTVFGIGFAVIRTLYTPEYAGGIFTNLFWSIYNLVLIAGAVYVAQERPQFRISPRIFREVRCELRLLDGTIAVGQTTNISESGMAVVFPAPVPVSGTLNLKLLDWEIEEINVFQVQAIRSSLDSQNRFYVGFRLVNRTDEQHRQLIRHMFGSADVWEQYHRRTDTGRSFLSLLATPLRLVGKEEKASRRRTVRMQLNLPCLVETGAHALPGYSQEISETGIAVYLKPDAQILSLDETVGLKIQWSNGHISALQAQVKRIEAAKDGQLRVGLNFINVSREQRVEIIHQLYQTSDGLVRVAPPVPRILTCQLTLPDGRIGSALTQEISEMGVIMGLSDDIPLSNGMNVTVDLHWEDGETSRYSGIIKGTLPAGPGNLPMTFVAFNHLDIPALDQLSRRLHEPVDSEAFTHLHAV